MNESGVIGHVIPPSDSEALREAMNDFSSIHKKTRVMRHAVPKRDEALFTGENMYIVYQELYRELFGYDVDSVVTKFDRGSNA
ncbi:glycosyltransferase [Microbulbifer okhotskensis]|uniref:glycosyltransferase n=1 Tax=Microbulbifer okhotskensis TaxID=2926617 RepID=UPI00273A60D0|nr:hypothetical protein [Microbulbifer okhotskensis]